MSNKILLDAGDRNLTPVQWRTLDARDKPGVLTETAVDQAPEREETKQDPSSAGQLRQEIEKAAEEAYARGFSMGAESGKSEAAAEVRPVIERLSQSIKKLADLRPALRRSAEEDMVKLSIAVARRILNRELSIDPDCVQSIVRVALEKLQSREISRVRVHASCEGAVRSCLTHLGASNQIQLAPDSSLEVGGLIFETTHGDFDASVESQLREIEGGFADRLNG